MTREQRALKRQFQKAAKAIESKPVVPVYSVRDKQVGWCTRHGEFIANASNLRVLVQPNSNADTTIEDRRARVYASRVSRQWHYALLP